jgi:hypothetical protein
MDTVLGLIGLVLFIVSIICLAAAVTWVVVRVSPNPADRKARQAE